MTIILKIFAYCLQRFFLLYYLRVDVYTIDINCAVTTWLTSISTCNSRRPGSFRMEAFRRHRRIEVHSSMLMSLRRPGLASVDAFTGQGGRLRQRYSVRKNAFLFRFVTDVSKR